MASYVFNKFKADLMKGLHNLSASNDDYKLALVVSAAAFNSTSGVSALSDIIDTWNTLSATWDITTCASYNSVGYIQRGLSGCNVSAANDTPGDEGRWLADNITWQSSTIDCDGCVIYKASNGLMVCAIDFGARKSSSNGDFTIQWNNQGILNLS